MPITFSSIIRFVAVLFLIFIIGCNNSTEPQKTQEPTTSMSLTGSVNSSFDNTATTYQGTSKIIELTNEYRLDINLAAKSKSPEGNQYAVLSFSLPFTSGNGLITPGSYSLTKSDVSKIGFADYQLVESEGNFSRFKFEGDKLFLEIISSDSESIKARFSCELTAILSERMRDGIRENIQLSGKTRAEGKFNLMLE